MGFFSRDDKDDDIVKKKVDEEETEEESEDEEEEEYDSYECDFECENCGSEETRDIPIGTTVEAFVKDKKCEFCGCSLKQ